MNNKRNDIIYIYLFFSSVDSLCFPCFVRPVHVNFEYNISPFVLNFSPLFFSFFFLPRSRHICAHFYLLFCRAFFALLEYSIWFPNYAARYARPIVRLYKNLGSGRESRCKCVLGLIVAASPPKPMSTANRQVFARGSAGISYSNSWLFVASIGLW